MLVLWGQSIYYLGTWTLRGGDPIEVFRPLGTGDYESEVFVILGPSVDDANPALPIISNIP